MKRLFAAIIVLTSSGLFGQTSPQLLEEIEAIEWMTEQYPPFNYVDEDDGQLKGITVDILVAMFEKIGAKTTRQDLRVLPWARGYKALLEKPGTALFSTTYTYERLQQFKFVGPIIPTRVSVIADANSKIDALDDLSELKIGTVRDDVGDQLIRTLGVADHAIEQSHSAFNLVQMLAKGRLDAIVYAEDIARYQFAKAGIDFKRFETVLILKNSHMGYAFHESTDPRMLEPLRKALDELRADGTVDRIYSKYARSTMSSAGLGSHE